MMSVSGGAAYSRSVCRTYSSRDSPSRTDPLEFCVPFSCPFPFGNAVALSGLSEELANSPRSLEPFPLPEDDSCSGAPTLGPLCWQAHQLPPLQRSCSFLVHG